MRILLIEDEPKTARYLLRGLSENGFVIDVAADGEDGLFMAATRDYDLLVVDIMLPGRDGWSVVTELRRTKATPVIFLTARDNVEDRVKGLELGADDYLVKPFAFSELVARVRSVLRRGPGRQPDTLRVSDLEIDFPRQKVNRSGRSIRLTSKEFVLLSLLVRRLRSKVDEPFKAKLIHTERGRGYVLEER